MVLELVTNLTRSRPSKESTEFEADDQGRITLAHQTGDTQLRKVKRRLRSTPGKRYRDMMDLAHTQVAGSGFMVERESLLGDGALMKQFFREFVPIRGDGQVNLRLIHMLLNLTISEHSLMIRALGLDQLASTELDATHVSAAALRALDKTAEIYQFLEFLSIKGPSKSSLAAGWLLVDEPDILESEMKIYPGPKERAAAVPNLSPHDLLLSVPGHVKAWRLLADVSAAAE
jgi:hypothetical protein